MKSACLIANATGHTITSKQCRKLPGGSVVPDCVMTTNITAKVRGEDWTAFFCPPKPDDVGLYLFYLTIVKYICRLFC